MDNVRKVSPGTKISVVLPVFNESAVLHNLYQTVINTLKELNITYEIIFINDGSTDGSGEILDELAQKDDCVTVIHFTRNFGHQAALQAGLEYSTGDAVIVMDSDMQDNPQAIPIFVKEWLAGNDIVYAIRTNRKENVVKVFLFNSFYRFLKLISDIKLPLDAGNFGLLDRTACDQILSLPEHDRYYPGLRGWVGCRQKGIEVERGERYDESTRVGLKGLFRLAKTAIISFSSFPLSIFIFFGVVSMILFVVLSCVTLYHKFVLHIASPGWASFLITVSFFGSINALGIGILGAYVVRIYNEVRQRPLYLVDRCVNRPQKVNSETTDSHEPENQKTK